MRRPAESRPIDRVGTPDAGRREDFVAVEAPLTLTSQGDAWLTTMRTPGDDRELILGWLYHEGLLREPHIEISSLSVCGKPGEANYGDIYEVVPNAMMEARVKARDPALSARTQLTSCGVCGHRTLAELVETARSLRSRPAEQTWPVATLTQLVTTFSETQPLFAQTGCTHAAALVNTRGEVLLLREDVGRHNAVDKVVGSLALRGQLPVSDDQALFVSSRASFEIVHKGIVAGFSNIFCLSAPTSLAVDLANQCGVLLVAFFRAGGFNVYSGHSRLTSEQP
jgi:FdhD protein